MEENDQLNQVLIEGSDEEDDLNVGQSQEPFSLAQEMSTQNHNEQDVTAPIENILDSIMTDQIPQSLTQTVRNAAPISNSIPILQTTKNPPVGFFDSTQGMPNANRPNPLQQNDQTAPQILNPEMTQANNNFLNQNLGQDSRPVSLGYPGGANRLSHSLNETDYQQVEYGRGEKPLDLFLEGTYENGVKSTREPLRVFTQAMEPPLITKKNGEQTYLHFDEKSYYYPNALRDLNESDGFLGFYSQLAKEQFKTESHIKKDKYVDDSQVLKMMVCVTMYSEEKVFLEQTLYRISRNLEGFNQLGLKDFQLIVVVIQDGIMKMKEEVVDFYCNLEGDQWHHQRNLKVRRFEIQRQIDFLESTGNQKAVLDANEGLPYTIPKRTALVYQNRLQFIKQNDNDRQERPKVYSSSSKQGQSDNQPCLTVFSVFKHKNAKKLSSHMWFFEGFCRQFKPKYCALIDVGTLPAADGLVKFYLAMEGDSKIGGVCGFLGLEAPPNYDRQVERESGDMVQMNNLLERKKQETSALPWKKKLESQKAANKVKSQTEANQDEDNKKKEEEKENSKNRKIEETKKFQYFFFFFFSIPLLIIRVIFKYLNKLMIKMKIYYAIKWISVNYIEKVGSLRKAQVYEYTMAHMVDKNFESLLGFLHVLPGAWSAYRCAALQVRFSNRQNLLQKKYFKQIMNPDQLENNIKEANMFLAEDRILCLGIFCQPDHHYTLKYIPDAYAFTDPVETLEEFMNQRRRWINSTLYALDYVLKHYKFHVIESDHSSFQKGFLLPLNMLFARIGDLNSYLIPAFYFFVALMSSFQFLAPKSNDGYLYVQPQDQPQVTQECVYNYQLQDTDKTCLPPAIKDNCFEYCGDKDYPQYIYSSLTLIPAAYILCFVLIVFASLTFKVRKMNSKEYEDLRSFLLTKDQAAAVKQDNEEIKQLDQQINEESDDKKAIKQKEKELENKKKELRNQIFEFTKEKYSQYVKQISKHHVKLNPDEKKFKIMYDKLNSQEYANNVFKILAMVMSIISMLIMVIVTLAVLMNITNSGLGIMKGFTQLSDSLRTYVIVMVCLNLGSFLLIMLVHLLCQPKLVWSILTSYWSYLVYQPVYNFVLIIYSFCNLDDVTWGTKGLSESSGGNSYFVEKVKFLTRWLASNMILLLLLISINIYSSSTPYVVLGLGLYGTSYLSFKTILAVINYLKYFIFNKLKYKSIANKTRTENLRKEKDLQNYYKQYIRQLELQNQTMSQANVNIYDNRSISGSYQQNFQLRGTLRPPTTK